MNTLVRDEGVAGSNPATPTIALSANHLLSASMGRTYAGKPRGELLAGIPSPQVAVRGHILRKKPWES
jgi:hypothetical protein